MEAENHKKNKKKTKKITCPFGRRVGRSKLYESTKRQIEQEIIQNDQGANFGILQKTQNNIIQLSLMHNNLYRCVNPGLY